MVLVVNFKISNFELFKIYFFFFINFLRFAILFAGARVVRVLRGCGLRSLTVPGARNDCSRLKSLADRLPPGDYPGLVAVARLLGKRVVPDTSQAPSPARSFLLERACEEVAVAASLVAYRFAAMRHVQPRR